MPVSGWLVFGPQARQRGKLEELLHTATTLPAKKPLWQRQGRQKRYGLSLGRLRRAVKRGNYFIKSIFVNHLMDFFRAGRQCFTRGFASRFRPSGRGFSAGYFGFCAGGNQCRSRRVNSSSKIVEAGLPCARRMSARPPPRKSATESAARNRTPTSRRMPSRSCAVF